MAAAKVWRALFFFAALRQAASLQTSNKTARLRKNQERARNELAFDLDVLRQHMHEKLSTSKVEEKKLTYEKALEAKYDELDEETAKTHALRQEIRRINESSNYAREESLRLLEESNVFRQQLESLDMNMSTARDFALEAAVNGTEILHEANETQVLRELEAEQKAKEDSRSKKENFGKIKKLAMLDVGQKDPATQAETQEMLDSLLSSVSELEEQNERDLVALKAQFDDKMTSAEKELVKQRSMQEQLTEEKNAAQRLQLRLSIAYKTSKEIHDNLKNRTRALHNFVDNLGTKKH